MEARKQTDERQWLRWQAIAIRKRGHLLGVVRAKDADSAVKFWIEEYGVTNPDERRRLAAYRLG